MVVLVTGGARSGKSAFAEAYAASKGATGIYIATSQIYDEEMKERVALHRQQREKGRFSWKTIEEPVHIAELIENIGKGKVDYDSSAASSPEGNQPPIVLVDCLTVWISNVMFPLDEAGSPPEPALSMKLAEEQIDRLAAAAQHFNGTLILVTNEVGSGVVPSYASGRLFRDAAGRMNQRLAAISSEVFLVTAGIPVELKRIRYSL